MKRGTPDHPKTRALAKALSLTRWEAVGVLESLWHFTARFAPRGDIGRWSNEDIAKGIDWLGSAELLISALVENRWIDSDKAYRLLIHDWPQHCDQAVKKYLHRNKLRFATASGRRPAKKQSMSGPPLPLPEPLPEPTEGDREATSPAPVEPPPPPPGPRVPGPGPRPPAQWPAWLAAYGETWHAAYGLDSDPPWGEMHQFLGPLVEKHDHAVVLARWTRFVRSKSDPSWARPRRFVESFGVYADDVTAVATRGAAPSQGRKQTAAEITAETMRKALERDRQRGGGGA